MMSDYERGRHDALRDLSAAIQDASRREKIAILNTWVSILNALKNFIEREERRLVTRHLNKGNDNDGR